MKKKFGVFFEILLILKLLLEEFIDLILIV